MPAQQGEYVQALAEIERGQKRSHRVWSTFPQIDGLGSSPTAKRFAVESAAEAKAYLRHPVLCPRLAACAEAALRVERHTTREVSGSPDDPKLHSSTTE